MKGVTIVVALVVGLVLAAGAAAQLGLKGTIVMKDCFC